MYDSIALFMGALLDALIGPNLFVPGEPFLIAAGYQLHQGVWTGVIAVVLGGLIGDQLSYFIGRKYGRIAQKKLMGWQPKTRRPIARCRLLLQKKGSFVLVFARLLGPVAWIVPFIAGVNHIEWRRFSLFATFGLILGIGQFVAWGYALSYGVEAFPWVMETKTFLMEHLYLLIALSTVALFVFFAKKYQWQKATSKCVFAIVVAFAYLNYSHFFWVADDVVEKPIAVPLKFNVADSSFKVFPGLSSIFDAQAVNVVLVDDAPMDLMNALGWIENKTFSRDDIEFLEYVSLIKNKTPPVSDLFWNGRPQDMAFQLPGNLLQRSHIRWWNAGVNKEGKQVWVGALSFDDGLTLTPYRGIITLLHRINPDVDAERDRLAKSISQQLPELMISTTGVSLPITQDEKHDYHTDGSVLMISPSHTVSLASIHTVRDGSIPLPE